VQLFRELLAKRALAGPEQATSGRNDKYLCPACQSQSEARQRYLAILSEGLAAVPEIRAAYEAAPGFCIPHLAILLETIKDPGIQTYLSATEERNLAGLWDEIQEFIRKHDYRYSHETYGGESDSWHRAINKLTGNKIVF
jgi:hypothetical protein